MADGEPDGRVVPSDSGGCFVAGIVCTILCPTIEAGLVKAITTSVVQSFLCKSVFDGPLAYCQSNDNIFATREYCKSICDVIGPSVLHRPVCDFG